MFPRQESIRIPTFASPLVKQAQDAEPKTRDEERRARLKNDSQQWAGFGSLFRDLPGLPDLPDLDPAAAATATTSTSAPHSAARVPRQLSQSPLKLKPSPALFPAAPRRRVEVPPEPVELEQDDEVDAPPVAGPSREEPEPAVEVQQKKGRGTKRMSTGRRKSVPAPAPPSPVQLEVEVEVEADDNDELEVEEELAAGELAAGEVDVAREEVPVASGSGTTSSRRQSVLPPRRAKTKAAAKPLLPPKPTLVKKRPVQEVEEEVDDTDEVRPRAPAKRRSKPSPSKQVRVVVSPAPSSPSAASVANSASDVSGSDDSDGDGAKIKKKKGTKIRSERVKKNKGKLNAIDVAYGRIRRILKTKIENSTSTRTTKGLERFSSLVQVALLSHSDQLSTLSHRTTQVNSARSAAKQLRADLLGVQRARAGVGRLLAEEEAAWNTSRKRVDLTRRLHSFMNDLSSAALDLADPSVAAGVPPEGIEPRFKRLAGVFGVGGEGKRRLLGRIDRLNTELERV